jgi:hypothetical protein
MGATSIAAARSGTRGRPRAAALISPSITIPVDGGNPVLGKWQGVVLVDFNS